MFFHWLQNIYRLEYDHYDSHEVDPSCNDVAIQPISTLNQDHQNQRLNKIRLYLFFVNVRLCRKGLLEQSASSMKESLKFKWLLTRINKLLPVIFDDEIQVL